MTTIKKLLELAKNPEPFEEGTQEVWLDPDRAELVLKSHFDENIPGGSKGSSFVDETVDFITKIAPVECNNKIIDLGCGPGLYSQNLALKGYNVTGVDYNKKSIDYAISEADKMNLQIDYKIEDITNLEIESEFDVALLIYQIYGVFSPTNRRKILNNIYRGLKPGGLVLLDVLSEKSYEKFEENLMWFLSKKDSLISDKEHLTLYAAIKYPDNVTLAKNVLVFDDGKLVNYNYWNQHFSIENLEKEVNEAGFNLEKVYADVNGEEYKNNGEFFAAVLKKK
ncbi:class I SAM-dependent methyltransferase [Bacillus velezensis]|uniref:class I SAM-dependent methyltransferase n=1 Tax=Bacillus TaxID=1386 RepID=UPI00038731AE|nr:MULTISPECIES: methyltransferase domain-containing protein [Bacillus]AXY36449.1 class I SAM-dependent methyltransferase [Bacillus velezensis]KAF6600592.1 class I SAM-dependent methyltransferase [Bacillus sp. EKM420B]KAF6604996.1 class I SAM-dependent methyltransferase [Bacillus sp. EKM417B]MBC2599046.1 class I SAM-dependent methyltransferase [Bacillus velezensis]MCP1531309.1 2-polyprenyl-3-methyl-5-hydroxy-6-metoxy-1,4-benzoquinol methylase [Bacillus velezensis]